MDVFPAFVPLSGRKVVVAGEGEAALAKLRLLQGSPATVLHLDPEAALDAGSYAQVVLAFIAGSEPFVVAAAALAREAGAWVNVVDRPGMSDFHTPSIVDRGAVIAAVSTSGKAPVLAAKLRNELEASWPPGLGGLADLLGELQSEVRAALPEIGERRIYLRGLLDGPAGAAALAGEMDRARALARTGLASLETPQGCVWLLPRPARLDLLSLRALRIIGRADRIIADAKKDGDVIGMARRDAEQVDPAAITTSMLATWARAGLQTVWVFGGVPPAEAVDASRGFAIALAVLPTAQEPGYPEQAAVGSVLLSQPSSAASQAGATPCSDGRYCS